MDNEIIGSVQFGTKVLDYKLTKSKDEQKMTNISYINEEKKREVRAESFYRCG